MILDSVEVILDMKNKFDSLNDEFNVEGDIVQTDVVKSKIEQIKDSSLMTLKKIMIIQEEIFIVS